MHAGILVLFIVSKYSIAPSSEAAPHWDVKICDL